MRGITDQLQAHGLLCACPGEGANSKHLILGRFFPALFSSDFSAVFTISSFPTHTTHNMTILTHNISLSPKTSLSESETKEERTCIKDSKIQEGASPLPTPTFHYTCVVESFLFIYLHYTPNQISRRTQFGGCERSSRLLDRVVSGMALHYPRRHPISLAFYTITITGDSCNT